MTLAEWRGGKFACEAKALVPSACFWANNRHGANTILYQSLVNWAVRSCDPFVRAQDNWNVRRLPPYCSRSELTSSAKKRDEHRLLDTMGWESANVHFGSRQAIKAVQRDLSMRKANWLRVATKAMTRTTISDWKKWENGLGLG